MYETGRWRCWRRLQRKTNWNIKWFFLMVYYFFNVTLCFTPCEERRNKYRMKLQCSSIWTKSENWNNYQEIHTLVPQCTRWQYKAHIIIIMLLERAKPGPYPSPKLFLSAIFGVVGPRHVAPWPTPTHLCFTPVAGLRQAPLTRLFFGIFHSNWGDELAKVWIRYLAHVFLFILLYNKTS